MTLCTTKAWVVMGSIALALTLLPGCDEASNASTEPDQAQDVANDMAPDATTDSVAEDVHPRDTEDLAETSDDTSNLPPLREIPEGPWSVHEPGPYGVGYRVTSVVYQPEGHDGPRTLRLAIWYPTLVEYWYDSVYMGVIPRDGVFDEPPPAPGPFPMMVFSHGSTSVAEQSYFLTEFFTSHGWVVVAPDHTGNTWENLNEPLDLNAVHLRPQDVSAVIDEIEGLSADDPLAGMTNDTIIVAGHSFGGYTSLAVAGATYPVDDFLAGCSAGALAQDMCSAVRSNEAIFRAGFKDDRIDLAIPQSPGGTMAFGTDGASQIDIPVLLFTCGLDTMTPNALEGDPTWMALDGQADMRIDFATGGHFTFSSACEYMQSATNMEGCGVGYVPTSEAIPAVQAYTMAYARYHLWGDQTVAELLAGTPVMSSDATLSYKP